MVGGARRSALYGECGEDASASRMLRDERYKLIYYPVGNRSQLFDLQEDPDERVDLSLSEAHAAVCANLKEQLISQLYGSDLEWLDNGQLVGLPDRTYTPGSNKGLSGVRGLHFPSPPLDDSGQVVGIP